MFQLLFQCEGLCTKFVILHVFNKAVEGSGSMGTSKYVGEGVTYGVFYAVFLGTLVIFQTRVPADVPCQQAHTVCLRCHDVTLWHGIA